MRIVVPLAERLAETAPTAYWNVLYHLDSATKMLYDGKPIFPSRKALAVLNALRRPYFLQNRMRNIEERANRLELAGPGASGGLIQFDRG